MTENYYKLPDNLELPGDFQARLDEVSQFLIQELGDNLHTLILYGSAVRGGLDPDTSDLNLLLILEKSDSQAHQIICRITQGKIPVNPFLVERKGFRRAIRVFALKFLSIKRDYVVLYGKDILPELEVAPELFALLAEQQIRQIRARMVHVFLVSGPDHNEYLPLIIRLSSRIIVALSDALRDTDNVIPRALPDRIPVFEEVFGTQANVLRELLELKHFPVYSGRRVSEDFHKGLLELLTHALDWMEERHSKLPF